MTSLERIRAGIFKISNSKTIDEIEEAVNEYKKDNEKELRKILIPAEIIREIIPSVNVKLDIIKDLFNGKPLMKGDVDKLLKNDLVSVFNNDRFIGVYKIVEEEEDIIARPKFVMN